VSLDVAVGGIAIAAAIALAVGYRALRIPRPIRMEMPQNRWALLYRLSGGPRPTLLVLHPYSGDALSTAKYSGFLQAAIVRGFNVVVPEAVDHEWHDSPGAKTAADDIGVLTSLVNVLIGEGIADSTRVFIAGISNGGMMAFAMIAARADLFAGIGTISAGMPQHAFETFRPTKPMPLVMINGDADHVLPYRGGNVGNPGNFCRKLAGVEQTAALFAQANGCGPASEPRRTRLRERFREMERVEWPGCPPDAPATIVKVIGGGHDVIGWRVPLQAFLALPPRGSATAAAIVNRFAELSSNARSTSANR
jgi:polyhydroxybutyrate depolymerase